jgi:hypothetical protein
VPAMVWRALAGRGGKMGALRAASPVVAMALCAVLPLAPWTVRNWRTFHVFEPLAPRYANDPGEAVLRGFGRWYRTWAIEFASTDEVYWNYDDYPIALKDLPVRAFDAGSPEADADLRTRTEALLDDYNAVTTGTPQIDARFEALASERVRAHPLLCYVGLPASRTVDMMLRPRVEMMNVADEWWSDAASRAKRTFAAAYAALNLTYLALACVGFFAWRRRGWTSFDGLRCSELAYAMGAFVLLRTALLLTLDNSEPRYTLEFFPVVFIFAGALFAQRSGAAKEP